MKNIKTRLKERLLEIPASYRAFRENYKLASDLNLDLKDIQSCLNELVEKDILKQKIEYCCPKCKETTIMDDELLNECLNENGHFECDNCMDYINPETSKTGFVYYDIKDKEKLMNW